MENSGFLKSVSFGGFDKKDVLAYVDDLNTKIYTLEAEVEEKRALLGEEGAAPSNFERRDDNEYEEIIAKERTHVNELMAKIDTLNLTVQSHESALADKEAEVEKYKDKISELQEQLANAETNVVPEENSFDIGSVFIEAKKSADKIIAEAKHAAKKMNEDAKMLASQVVEEANGSAEKIVSEATAKADKAAADIEIQTDNMKKNAERIKTAIKSDIDGIYTTILELNDTISNFSKESSTSLERAAKIIDMTDLSNSENPTVAEATAKIAHSAASLQQTAKQAQPTPRPVQQHTFQPQQSAPKPVVAPQSAPAPKNVPQNNPAPRNYQTAPVQTSVKPNYSNLPKTDEPAKAMDVSKVNEHTPMNLTEMQEYAKSLQQQIEAEEENATAKPVF